MILPTVQKRSSFTFSNTVAGAVGFQRVYGVQYVTPVQCIAKSCLRFLFSAHTSGTRGGLLLQANVSSVLRCFSVQDGWYVSLLYAYKHLPHGFPISSSQSDRAPLISLINKVSLETMDTAVCEIPRRSAAPEILDPAHLARHATESLRSHFSPRSDVWCESSRAVSAWSYVRTPTITRLHD